MVVNGAVSAYYGEGCCGCGDLMGTGSCNQDGDGMVFSKLSAL